MTNLIKTRAFALVLLFTLAFIGQKPAIAHEDTDGPPVNWEQLQGIDYLDYITGPMDEGTDWEIVYQGSYNMPGNFINGFCVGTMRYKSRASMDGADPSDGWIWAYWATEVTPDMSRTDCRDLRAFARNKGGLGRTGILWLHGGGDRGSYQQASFIAAMTSTNDKKTFVLSISGPGVGYRCSGWDAIDAFKPECYQPPVRQNQISHGNIYRDSNDPFRGIAFGHGPNVDRHYAWAYGMATFRGVDLFYNVFGPLNGGFGKPNGIGFTDGRLVVGGISFGAVSALQLNNLDISEADVDVDAWYPEGIMAWHGSGAWQEVWAAEGSWNAYRAIVGPNNFIEFDYDPAYSLDCTKYDLNKACNDRDQFEAAEEAACCMQHYMDPASKDWRRKDIVADVLLVSGAQDESFNVKGFQETYLRLQDREPRDGSHRVYRMLQGDSDHFWYFPAKTPGEPPQEVVIEDETTESWEALSRDYTIDGQQEIINSHFPVNRELWAMHEFVERIGMNERIKFPAGPSAFKVVKIRDTFNSKIFRFMACYPNDWRNADLADLVPGEEITVNISLDKMFHVLPACEDEAIYEPGKATFDANYSDNYQFDEMCYDPDIADHPRHCADSSGNPTDISTEGETLFYMVDDCEQGMGICPFEGRYWGRLNTCKQFDLEFKNYGNNVPDQIVAWANLNYRYALISDKVHASSDVMVIDTDQTEGTSDLTDLKPCLRRKWNNSTDVPPWWEDPT
ncbi:MAG: hypothetical protein H6683_06975 [Deltaproteobacteria bacterium]|nr:hypothetical protein [Deltaproteobacteria bacterium]